MKKSIIAAATALALSAGMASAATVTVTGTPGTKGGNDFTGPGQLPGSFLENAVLTITGPVRLTFTLVGAESGYNNTFYAGGSDPGAIDEFNEGWGLYDSFTSDFLNTAELASLLFFSDAGVNAGQGAPGFGVYYSGDASALTSFYLAYDDQGVQGGTDDNHDDHLVFVQVSAVPLPAAGWMLLAGLGGLAAFQRSRRKA